MINRKHVRSGEDGFALVYMAVVTTTLLLFTGLAVDSGRSYLVKAQLSKAVDGAALGAARSLNSGNPRNEAVRIFKANFPPGFLGTLTDTDPTAAADFFTSTVVPASGTNVVTVTARAKLPTTFMKLGHTDEVMVRSSGEATRRMVDLAMVVDVSSSIGWRWPYVRDAVKTFIGAFDANNDRLALLTFGNGVSVLDQMPGARGFDKPKLIADVPNALPGGSTNMVEGLYRGWDELRSVPPGQQSGLRVLVLFTDGASNSVPGNWDALPGQGRALRTWDFPDNGADPDNQTHANPHIDGLYPTNSATAAASPSYTLTTAWNSTQTIPQAQWMPLTSWHAWHRSPGMPTTFPLQTNALTVNGQPQNLRRGLRQINAATGRYPAQVWNINNAARNLVEIISNDARNDNGDYKIRVYTIGMGELVQYDLGTIPEKSSEILKRMANDKTSPDYNANQLEGKFYYAQTPDDVAPAFAALQNQIIRLTK
ncbi:MAG: VWA domain-containing protein [Vicinamibacterales bacterium]|nr:VWA domain-containing protein [Vicinamibacterales bacterium]